MIKSSKNLKTFSRIAAFAVMLFAVVLFNASGAQAQIDPSVRSLNFSSVNVTRGQTVRLNVIYTKVVPIDPRVPPDPYLPPDPYRFTLSFIDRNGQVVAQKIVSLEIGKAALLDYTITDSNTSRTNVRGVVHFDGNDSALLPAVMPTVEVFNTDSGQTTVLDPGSIYSFNPQPDPPGFGFFGIARNQTARLNVVYVGFRNSSADHNPPGYIPNPINITLQFVNGDGRVMAESRQSVEYGKTVSFDFPAGAFPAGIRQRLRPVIIVAPDAGSIAPCVMPSLEVINNDTGKTSVFSPGSLIG